MIFKGDYKSYIGAHRGASAYRPENTMSAFKKAYELKADMIELDVQLTKDNKIVVIHDLKIDKYSDKKGFVSEFTYNELKNIDVGSWFSQEYSYERIPLFEEVLEWANNKIWISIELKESEYSRDDRLIKGLIDFLKSYKMEEQVQIMSSNHEALYEIRKYSNDVITNVIAGSRLHNPVQYLKELQAQVLNVPILHLSESLIKKMHDSGFYVHGSISDDISTWIELQKWGVDVMDTNIPDKMLEARLEK